MADLTVSVTDLAMDVVTRTARTLGFQDPASWAAFELVDLAVKRSRFSLGQCVDAERRAIEQGAAVVCGSVLPSSDPAVLCVRISTHLADGVVSRESHVALTSDGQYVSWPQNSA